MWVEPVILLFAFFVLVPAIAAIIGYAAWIGKPKNWDRSMYWIAFVASTVASGFLMVYAQRMRADVKTGHYTVEMLLFGLGVLLFGVAGGCMVGIFTYGRGNGPVWLAVASREDDPADDSNSDQRSDK